uniref:Uncharacterized protein n=1 Tax=Arundo donax TaxID=35708 RepID=A0A0A9G8D1_ARUDO
MFLETMCHYSQELMVCMVQQE